jgi:uncharacterized protein YciI
MVAWNEYKSEAASRGALALECYVVVSMPSNELSLVKQNLGAHLAYQAQQEALGNLMFAGPLSDLSGDKMEGAGMIIYQSKNLEEARQIADQDPMHLSGARTYTLRRWLINEGSLQLEIKLSAQSVKLRQD